MFPIYDMSRKGGTHTLFFHPEQQQFANTCMPASHLKGPVKKGNVKIIVAIIIKNPVDKEGELESGECQSNRNVVPIVYRGQSYVLYGRRSKFGSKGAKW